MTVDITSTSEATIVTLRAFVPVGDRDQVFEAHGTSKRDPHDKHNPEVATKLAYGRALESLGRKLQKQGNGLVKCIDDNNRANKKRKKRAKKAKAKRRALAAGS